MADNKRGRDKKAHDARKRQQQRDITMELERQDETEPPVDEAALTALETELETLEFPATGAEVVSAIGEYEVDEEYTAAELIPEIDEELFSSPESVRVRVQRPTVAAALKEILEASESLPHTELAGSQRKGYEKTLRALREIDADDDDEGIEVVTDWIVEQIHEKNKLPNSRSVRRRGAKFCRENGYSIRNDEWLGI